MSDRRSERPPGVPRRSIDRAAREPAAMLRGTAPLDAEPVAECETSCPDASSLLLHGSPILDTWDVWDVLEQLPRVRMLWVAEDLVDRAALDDRAML